MIIILKIFFVVLIIGVMSIDSPCAEQAKIKNIVNIDKKKPNLPLHKRLRLIEFRETLLPCQFKPGTKYKIGDSIRLDKISYKIIKIIPKTKELRRGGTIVKLDESKIILESEDSKYTITMQVGKDVYSPKPKAVIEDLATHKKYHVGIDDTIAMYIRPKPIFSKKTGRPLKRKTLKYKVISVDRHKEQVIVEHQNKRYLIKKSRSDDQRSQL